MSKTIIYCNIFPFFSSLCLEIKVFSPINLQSKVSMNRGHVLGSWPTVRKRRELVSIQSQKPNVEFAYLSLNCVVFFLSFLQETYTYNVHSLSWAPFSLLYFELNIKFICLSSLQTNKNYIEYFTIVNSLLVAKK